MPNKLVLFLSKFNDDSCEEPYKSPDGMDVFENCMQSNEAPTKHIIKTLKSSNDNLDEILYLSTDAVTAIDANHGISPKTRFKNSIEEYCVSIGAKVPHMNPFEYDADLNLFEQSLKKLLDELNKDDNVYIDATGGRRIDIMLILIMSRLLEFSGRTFKMATYSYHYEKPPGDAIPAETTVLVPDDSPEEIKNPDEATPVEIKNQVRDETNIYRYFDLISGVHEFATLGQTKTLNAYFERVGKSLLAQTPDLERLLDQMNKFTEALSICAMKKIEAPLIEIKQTLVALNNVTTQKNNPSDLLIIHLVPIIRSKPIFSSNLDFLSMLPIILKWCVECNMLQQALTIFFEKSPEYARKKGFYIADENTASSVANDDLERNLLNKFLSVPLETNGTNLYTLLKVPNISNALAESLSLQSASVAENIKNNMYVQKLYSLFDNVYPVSLIYKRRYDKNANVNTIVPDRILAQIDSPLNFWNILKSQNNCNSFVTASHGFNWNATKIYMMFSGLDLPSEKIGFTVNNPDKAKRFCVYWLYIQKLRNKICHASEVWDPSPFRDVIPNAPDKPTASYIKELLLEVV
ncbi:MAG: hypothetical protein LBT59_26280, partial [Clostridiales bacterium]|nr:hypothetical protein [Clostridiales bacterium]